MGGHINHFQVSTFKEEMNQKKENKIYRKDLSEDLLSPHCFLQSLFHVHVHIYFDFSPILSAETLNFDL